MTFDQSEYRVRCEWGIEGLRELAPISDDVVIVDVLSFSTCVDVAVSRGASVYPFPFKDQRLASYAAEVGAVPAAMHRSKDEVSLAPESLLSLGPGARIVLPSPNGSELSLSAGATTVITSCLRNFVAVAAFLRSAASIAIIPAGERWSNGALRPAIEDLVGAGALIYALEEYDLSPESKVALAAYRQAADDGLLATLHGCSSGKELIERGFADSVLLAALADSSKAVPILKEGAYVDALSL